MSLRLAYNMPDLFFSHNHRRDQLMKLLGDGYGTRVFHLAKGPRLLANCRVTSFTSIIRFDYMEEVRR